MDRCLARHLAAKRKKQTQQTQKNGAKGAKLSPIPLSSRRVTFLFLRRPGELDKEEQATLLLLCQSHPEMELVYDLVQEFAQMLRTRTGEELDGWLEKARASQIPELQSFVVGIERDKAAVVAGLTLPQSKGMVEGKVHKLKLIKRMGYGRAGFPLLRQRVLHAERKFSPRNRSQREKQPGAITKSVPDPTSASKSTVRLSAGRNECTRYSWAKSAASELVERRA